MYLNNLFSYEHYYLILYILQFSEYINILLTMSEKSYSSYDIYYLISYTYRTYHLYKKHLILSSKLSYFTV